MADIFARIKGMVYYTNGDTGVFSALYENGGLVQPFSADSLLNFKHLYKDKKSEVDQVFAAVDGSYTTSITQVTQSPDKTVSSYWLQFDGRLSETGDWCVQWINGALNVVQGGSAFSTLLATAAFKTAVDGMLESVAGTGNVSIA